MKTQFAGRRRSITRQAVTVGSVVCALISLGAPAFALTSDPSEATAGTVGSSGAAASSGGTGARGGASSGAGSAAATSADAAFATAAVVPKLTWRSCGKPLLCASAKVPLDWSRPRGATITLALAKLPATARSGKLGTIFVNPGGPGGSAIEMLESDPTFLPAAVRARFDIVGFDPRFVGNSRPAATCIYDEDYATFASSLPAFPVGDTQEASFLSAQAGYVAKCAGRSYLRYASTASVARDLELLRIAVGDSRLNYVGYSYGTYLGQVYAQLYPNRIRTMILDGVLDGVQWMGTTNSSTPFTARIGSAAGSSATFNRFLALCKAAKRTKCTLARQGNPAATYRWIADTLKAQPLSLGEGVELDYATLVSATTSALYSPEYWGSFADELEALYIEMVRAADPSAAEAVLAGGAAAELAPAEAASALRASGPSAKLRTVARSVYQRAPAGASRYSSASTPQRSFLAGSSSSRYERPLPSRPDPLPYVAPSDNELASFEAVTCSDTRNPTDGAVWTSVARAQDSTYPYFGRAWTWSGAGCVTWAQHDPNAYFGPLGRRTANPILVIGNTYDPATPYAGAVATAKRFPGARLLTVRGYGHTSAAVPSTCVNRTVTSYLLTAKTPKAGAYCNQPAVAFK